MEEAVTPQASGAVQPHSPPSSNPNGEEPVCYSVEAVLGPQLSRPFPNFFTTPRSQESSPLSSSNCTSGSANQSRIPYSLHDVLRSSTFGYTPTPPTAQTESYPPKTHFEEVIDPLLRPQTPKETVYLVNASNEANKPQEKMFKSLSSPHVHTGLISKTRPSLALTSGDHMKQDGNMPESVKPVQRASKHPSQLKPHLSVLTCDSRASSKPICATSGFTEFKGKAALKPVTSSIKLSDSANLVSCHFETKQPRKIQSGLKLGTKQHSDETTAGCSCKMAYCGGLAVGCKETVKRPFHSLFASPISDTLQHIDDSETGSCIPQSARPPPQSADCTSNHLKSALEPDKASARSFLSLFAAPLGAAPRTSPCSQLPVQLGDIASHLSDAKQRASNLEKSIPQQVRSDVKEISNAPRFPNSSPNPKIDNKNSSAGHRKPCPEQLVNPVCSLVSESLSEMSAGPSRTCSYQQQPDMSSHKAGPASADSVLKTLFACLRPYQGDGEQEDGVHISVPSESEKTDRGGLGCVFVKPQQKSKKKRRRKKTLKTKDSHKQSTEEAAADSAQHHLLSPASLQTPQISLETPGRFTLSSSGTTESQVRDSGAHDLPFKPALLMHHARPRLKHTPEERELINGDVADTPFKELFKTLDTTVFHPRC
ncbi:uncharacterized protein [Pempheris klunzingeri]|uniref:uncharacterized protein n=1 Tax=Pempheris klunzingeri TaxID=3127111 RepID=UPI00397EF312